MIDFQGILDSIIAWGTGLVNGLVGGYVDFVEAGPIWSIVSWILGLFN